MDNHIKPTTDELDEKINETVKELENNPPTDTPPDDTKPDEKPVDNPSTDPPVDPPQDDLKPDEKPVETQAEIDYKKKFVENQKENIILNAKNKKLNEVIEKTIDVPEPTEDEMRIEDPEWDLRSSWEKKMAKENLLNSRRFKILHEVSQSNKDLDIWVKKVDGFIGDPENLQKYPKLEGKAEEFKLFASKPSRYNIDFETMVLAFLQDIESHKEIRKKGSMFESGSGGPNDKLKPKSDKISMDEAIKIKKDNYPRYKRLLLENKIDNSEL